MNTDIVTHFLTGGVDPDKTLAWLRAAPPPLPVPPRPLRFASDAQLAFERAVRRGPQGRCSGCGWLTPESYREGFPPVCPVCQAAERISRYVQKFTGVARDFTMKGRDRDWLLALAGRCGIPWGETPEGETPTAENACPDCLARVQTERPEQWHCGSWRDGSRRSACCYQRHIERLTQQLLHASTNQPQPS